MGLHHIELTNNKKIYLASDFHLGAPSAEKSLVRERKIIRWLEEVSQDAAMVVLVGDIFDFWFEYKTVVPKGFIRFQGKVAELRDKGIEVIFFGGNHDMWMFGYFTDELGIPCYLTPQSCVWNGQRVLIGHGDGLGPSDLGYKFVKWLLFNNKLAKWFYGRVLHPNIGVGLAHLWSSKRKANMSTKQSYPFEAVEKEWIWNYCVQRESIMHHDLYIFGHRHLTLDLPVPPQSRYVNLGEWINTYSYAVFDGQKLDIKYFEQETIIK